MANRKMNRNSKYTTLIGLFVGTVLGFFVTARLRSSIMSGNLMTFTCGSESESFYSSADNDQPQIIHEVDSNKGKSLVFVGVMTADKFLSTRALAVYETWGKTLPGKLAFFSSSSSSTTANIPLIRLPGVDDSYPPQKKSFLMLKYMYDHFSDKFEWFMRADDDVYVRSDKLEMFLRSVNSSQPHFIGQAGMGNKEEFGQLSLEEDENFCMGGPGMVLSRETLRRVVPHVKYCIKNLYSTHEDVEIGRCIRKFAGVSCTWAYEMQNIFYHNSSGSEAFTGNLRQKEIHRAITLHPIKHHQYQYRLHNYMQSLRIQELEQTILLLLRDIRDANHALNETSSSTDLELDLERLGRKPSLSKLKVSTVDDVIPWEFFSRVIFTDTGSNPKHRMDESLKVALDSVVTQVMESMNKYSVHRVIDFKEIYYGYKRVVPSHGVDYILDMLLTYKKYSGQRATHRVRKHAYLQQSFTQMQIRELDVNEISDKTISFILPLAGRFSTLQRFMTNFEEVCLKNKLAVRLVLVLYKTDDKDGVSQYTQTRKLFEKIKDRYKNVDMKLVEAGSKFSRASALQQGAMQTTANSLLFFVDVDMAFDAACLERVQLNTVEGRQVYFPVVFSQYDPGNAERPRPNVSLINDNAGYWRQFGFGIGSMYKSDLISVGGFDTSIHGWGREDVDLYDKIVRSNLTVFRAADPGLVHVYHAIECDKALLPQQYVMCVGSQANSLGSVSKLADYVYKNLMTEEGTIISI